MITSLNNFLLERSKNDPFQEVYMEKKLAIFLIGAPASGKSWYLQQEILRKNPQFKIIDPDLKSNILTKYSHRLKSGFKNRISHTDYENILTGETETYPRVTGLNVEIESRFNILLNEGTNIIYDSTGNNKKLLTYLVDKCKSYNYKVMFLHILGTNLDWSIDQSKLRAANIGRPVDEYYLRDLYDKSQSMISYYSNLNIDSYYIIWNRGSGIMPKYYKYENGKLLKKSGSEYTKIVKESVDNRNDIYAFDMDDTLLESPKFSDFYKNGLPPIDSDMGKIIDDELGKYNISREEVEIQFNRITVPSDKAPFIWDTNKNGRSIMPKPDTFYQTKESLGSKVYIDIKNIFDKAENKTIITGRNESLREIVEDHLYNKGLYANKGVYLAPFNKVESIDIAKWKGMVLDKLCEKYSTVYFYEDKLSWIETILDTVNHNNLIIYYVNDGKVIKEY